MALELIPDGSANEVGAIRVEPFLNQQVDVTEIDMTEVDRDLLVVRAPGSELIDTVCQSAPSICHPMGCIWAWSKPVQETWPRLEKGAGDRQGGSAVARSRTGA